MAFDKLVVLPLGALDPQDVVEQQVVVVGRGQALEAEIRPVHDHLAELADFGVERQSVLAMRLCLSLL